jgi:hypothetical protein
MKKLMIAIALLLFAGIAFSQTLKVGGTVAIHEWTLKLNPDVTMNQFLEFWEKNLLLEMKKLMPESTPMVLKGTGEDNKYDYAGLYYYNSLADARKYFKEDGSPTEEGAVIMQNMGPIMMELSKLGEFTWSAKDWIIIK